MTDEKTLGPEETAVRVALWRALHVQIDPAPHVFEDEIGLQLLAPDPGWRRRGDMHPQGTRRNRASIVARARYIEDLLAKQIEDGMTQYVNLGAGLDSFPQRRPDLAARLTTFEVDQPRPQAWKQQRLSELGFGTPEWLRFVPVDFEAGDSLWDLLGRAGFDRAKPAFVVSTGVTLYLTREANAATFREISALASGSIMAATFMLPIDLIEAEERPARSGIERATRAAGHPFVSFFSPEEMISLAQETGFKEAEHVSAAKLAELYFTGREDGLRPSSLEELLVAKI